MSCFPWSPSSSESGGLPVPTQLAQGMLGERRLLSPTLPDPQRFIRSAPGRGCVERCGMLTSPGAELMSIGMLTSPGAELTSIALRSA